MSNQHDPAQKELSDQGFVYSKIGFIPKDESYVSFTLRLDKAVYFNTPEPDPPAHLIAQLVFRGTVVPPVILHFWNLQHFDLLIFNSSDAEVYRWSSGRAIPDVPAWIPVVGEVIWKVEVVLADSNGKSLPAGRYIAKASLPTVVEDTNLDDIRGYIDPRQVPVEGTGYSATVGFLISNQLKFIG
jgi:hypothetical protein